MERRYLHESKSSNKFLSRTFVQLRPFSIQKRLESSNRQPSVPVFNFHPPQSQPKHPIPNETEYFRTKFILSLTKKEEQREIKEWKGWKKRVNGPKLFKATEKLTLPNTLNGHFNICVQNRQPETIQTERMEVKNNDYSNTQQNKRILRVKSAVINNSTTRMQERDNSTEQYK